MSCGRAIKHIRNLLQRRPLCALQTPDKPSSLTGPPPPDKPPWKVLFFGTDHFALESLKLLSSSRTSADPLVETLEVVTLSGDFPVKRFAQQNQLTVHSWPPDISTGQFHVGVVVSFGCLITERIINKFPLGILNVHPSLLPRWRGPAPVFHTIMHGDTVTGVTIMQIRPRRFDVGPILSQETYPIQKKHTSDELGEILAVKGAQMLIDTLRTLFEKLQNMKEQSQTGATFAPKIDKSSSWLVWEEQTAEDIDCLFRAIGSRIPLRTLWTGRTVKLTDFVGKLHDVLQDGQVPGSVIFLKESNILSVRCKDGWVAFRAVVLKKRLTAADFYNGYLHQSLKGTQIVHALFVSGKQSTQKHQTKNTTGTRPQSNCSRTMRTPTKCPS